MNTSVLLIYYSCTVSIHLQHPVTAAQLMCGKKLKYSDETYDSSHTCRLLWLVAL